MGDKNSVFVFLDDDEKPLGKFDVPINFDFDTTKIPDGDHKLKIVGKDPYGKEGIRLIKFTVRNGPAIDIEGLNDNAVVDGVVPLMINAYGKGGKKQFLIDGSETPKSIPSWFWAGIIFFTGWAVYYLITSLT